MFNLWASASRSRLDSFHEAWPSPPAYPFSCSGVSRVR